MNLRPYQQAAVEAVMAAFAESSSTLVVMPTGCGKTQVFCELIRRHLPARSMVLVHREELCNQAVSRLRSFGIEADVEMASRRASHSFWGKSEVIVSSVQTQISGAADAKRMHRFNPDEFGLVVCDEAHHSTAQSWVSVVEHYRKNPRVKILGVTATPDRADEVALGKVFDSVAYDYEILDAIHDGWLTPIRQQMVVVEGLDFSAVRTTAGDLNGADLAEVMEAEKALHEVASSTLDIAGDRKTIIFAASVKQAEMLSEILNRYKPGSAAWVCGKTPRDERHQTLSNFNNGKLQYVVNVGVLTEGYDSPGVEVVVMARPTKSRSLYAQMAGRATRTLPGCVDSLPCPETRRRAISASKKPYCLIVDFVGNSGRHKLISTADLLGGDYDDDVIEAAAKKARKKGGPVDMKEVLEQEEEEKRKRIEEAKRREAARLAHLVGRAKFSVRSVDPFDALDLQPHRARGWDAGKSLSQKQADLLLRQGIDPAGMPYHAAKQVLNELFRRWNQKLCTVKQANLLKRFGYETKNLKMDEASKLIDALARNNWRKP